MSDKKPRVLLVDDNELNCDMLSRRLERKGYAVKVANDGPTALSMLASAAFDIMLLDVMMPGMTGIEVLDRVRGERSLVGLPIIMVTAKNESQDVVDALSKGANDYVTKPIDLPILLARMETQLAVARSATKPQSGHFHRLGGNSSAAPEQMDLLCSRCMTCVDPEMKWCSECGDPRPGEGWERVNRARLPLLGTRIGERYFLDRFAGAGSMANVYRARDLDLGKHFAVKVFDFDEESSGPPPATSRALAATEVAAMSRVQSPHIVQIFEVLQLEETSFGVVMEYVDGVELGHVIERSGAIHHDLAMDIVRQIALGLHEVHAAGFVHRDLKPNNVALSQLPGGRYFAKILDFGVVAIVGNSGGGFWGTPLYAAPEQFDDPRNVDHRADIYGLGALFYHVLVGRPPYRGSTLRALFELHRSGAIPDLPPAMMRSEKGPGMQRLIHRMMAKDPQRRPLSVLNVIEILDAMI